MDYKQNTLKRLMSHCYVDFDGCWIFMGTLKCGYGILSYNGKYVKVHRLIMSLTQSFPLFSEKMILHKCNIRRCYNPEHLYVGNHLKNMQDRKAAGN